MEQFEKDLKEFRSVPSNSVWERLDNKLEHKRNKFRITKLRYISIAAVISSFVAVGAVLNMYMDSYNPNLFVSSIEYEPIIMEELEKSTESIYDLKNLKLLNDTYLKIKGF